MGLFDRFRKRTDEPAVPPSPPPQPSLASICYGIAYFILPHYAFKDYAKVASIFTDTPTTVGPFFYLMGCQIQKVEPVREDATRFKAHQGQLDDQRDYFIVEYPTPPPIDFGAADPADSPVLAPYFSAIIRNRQTTAVSYYTLGQAPFGGGTTFRSVTPEGSNCNHGPGPEPQLNSFLARLRSAG
jgi:hypothetical protein